MTVAHSSTKKIDLSHLLQYNVGKNRSSDLVGQKFGRLTIVEKMGKDRHNNALWLGLCDCGGKAITRTHTLMASRVKSCGCWHKDRVSEAATKPKVQRIEKYCPTCDEVKAASLFGRRSTAADGLTSQCKKCKNVRYKQANAAKTLEQATFRTARIKRATPPWVARSDLLKFYEISYQLSIETGIKHHVDHVIPLIHDLVCGLHCPANLNVIPWNENLSKGNKWD